MSLKPNEDESQLLPHQSLAHLLSCSCFCVSGTPEVQVYYFITVSSLSCEDILLTQGFMGLDGWKPLSSTGLWIRSSGFVPVSDVGRCLFVSRGQEEETVSSSPPLEARRSQRSVIVTETHPDTPTSLNPSQLWEETTGQEVFMETQRRQVRTVGFILKELFGLMHLTKTPPCEDVNKKPDYGNKLLSKIFISRRNL